MSDGPPDWDIPPPDVDSYGQTSGGGRSGSKNDRRPPPPKLTPDEIAQLSNDFYAWLEGPQTLQQLKALLPEHVDARVFIATAKTAVLLKPKMLREHLRPSLLIAIMKAASMGLLPDGKQGALVERYDSDAKGYTVAFQSMVWGITKLGRETGAIKSIRAVIVFRGENFRVLAGEEDRIEHEIDPDIVEEAYAALNGGRDSFGNPLAKPADFLARVRAAYCLITAPDGTITRRWMTHQRIVSLWEASKAANGPWNSRWVDEMVCKGLILFTSKWINLDPSTAEAKRFQAALMSDMEVDFNRQGQISAPADDDPTPLRQQAALPPPTDKLSGLEDALMGNMAKAAAGRQKVPTTTVSDVSSTKSQDRVGNQGGGNQGGGNQGSGKSGIAPPPAPDQSWIGKTEAALFATTQSDVWLKILVSAITDCPSLDDLAELRSVESVKVAEKSAPVQTRSQIAAAFSEAGKRLAEAVIPDKPSTDDEMEGWSGLQGPGPGETADA